MLRLISVLAIVVSVLAFAAPSVDAAGQGDRGRFGGEITRIDADRGVFQLTNGDRSIIVATGDRTHIFINGERARFGALEVGMRARVGGRWQQNDSGDKFLRARVVRARAGDDRR